MNINKHYLVPFIPFYCGLAYILGIIYFMVITNYGDLVSVQDKIAFFSNNYLSMFFVMNLIYVVFGILMVFLSFLFYSLCTKNLLNKVGLAFGLFWSFAVILAGTLFNIGMNKVLEITIVNPDLAIQTWTIIEIIFSSIGGGTEILGGIWILIISILAFKEKFFNKFISVLGLVIGTSGILSHIPHLEFFQIVFGLLQIIWFFAISYPLFAIFKTVK